MMYNSNKNLLKNYINQGIDKDGYLEKLAEDLVQRKTNPHSAALDIIKRFNWFPSR